MYVTSSSRVVRRRFALGVAGLLVAVAAAIVPSQTSYAGPTPATAEAIEALPFSSHAGGTWVPEPPATGSDNVNLSAACNGGAPMYRVRWFSYTPAATTTVVARGDMYATFSGRIRQGNGVAILTSAKAVIDCNLSDNSGVYFGRTVGLAGPVKVAAGTTVYIVQFVLDEPPDDPCSFACDADQNLHVRAVGAYPLADDRVNATPITRSPAALTVDTTLSTRNKDDRSPFDGCSGDLEATRSVWWTVTPTTTGKFVASVEPAAYSLGYVKLTSDGGPVMEDGCDGATPTLEAGQTYLVMAGLVMQWYEDEEAISGEPVTLRVTSAPSLGRPDLVVTNVVTSPASPKAGDPVTFRATIKNQGTAPTQGGVAHGVAFRVDGATKTWSDTFNASLLPGQSVTVTTNGGPAGASTWPATVGSHTVTAIVDDVNRIPGELNENNNTKTAPLTVAAGPARPDLVVTGVSWTPANPATGAAVTFSATIKNSGSAATPAGVVHGAAFRVDGVTKAWSDTSKTSLAPGASTTLTANGGPAGKATWPATTGPHTVTAIVDDVNRMPGEADETNNTLAVPLTIGATQSRPDVVVTGISWTPTSPAPGAPVKLTATVKNIGTRSTPNGTVVGVSFQPNGKTTQATNSDTFKGPLHPDQTITLTANGGGTDGAWTPPTGSTPVVAVVDDIFRFPEANEANNTLKTTVTSG